MSVWKEDIKAKGDGVTSNRNVGAGSTNSGEAEVELAERSSQGNVDTQKKEQDIGTTRARNDGDNSTSSVANAEAPVEYKVYKRRWFGLVQITLLNVIVSWDVSRRHKSLNQHSRVV